MIENPSRLGLLSSMMNGRMCCFHPENWHTPVHGTVTGLQLEDGSRLNYIVWILYPSHECPQTVKLFVRFDPETRRQVRCRIL